MHLTHWYIWSSSAKTAYIYTLTGYIVTKFEVDEKTIPFLLDWWGEGGLKVTRSMV